MASPSPEHWMRRAIALSCRGLPAPNPHVGCVLVRDGESVGQGWHGYAGALHAEGMALLQAGERARGTEAFVTLEPCNHQGRQPPCAPALIQAGVRKVWIAVSDPNPNVKGGGAAALLEAGIEVVQGLLAEEATEANRTWLAAMAMRRPFITLKAAASIDGRIALSSGESQWITGERARQASRRLRAEMGAVLVGRGTVEADNPKLTARIKGHPNEPVRVVLDPHRRLAEDRLVFAGAGSTVRVADESHALLGDLAIPISNEGFDLNRLMSELWDRGLTGVLVEGGAKTISSFLRAGLADRLDLFVGNVVLGSGPAWLDFPLLEKLDRASRWKLKFVRKLGNDVWLRYEPSEA